MGFFKVWTRSFWFQQKFLDLVNMLVSSATFSILVNGSPTTFFWASHGLREGDLLSPILFILMAKCLGSFVEKMVQKKDFLGLRPSSKDLTCSYQKIVDVSIVMGEASVKNARNIKRLLRIMGKL